jgi:hypothetical protein
MEQEKQIWHLVAFPQGFMDGSKFLYDAEVNKDRTQFEMFRKSQGFNEYLIGGRLRGTFDDKEALLKIIEAQDSPWGLCEGFYTYLVVEKHVLNCIDGCDFGDFENGEVWFKFEKIGEEDYKYVQIEKPYYLERIVGFA